MEQLDVFMELTGGDNITTTAANVAGVVVLSLGVGKIIDTVDWARDKYSNLKARQKLVGRVATRRAIENLM